MIQQKKSLDNFVRAVEALIAVVIIVGSEGNRHLMAERRVFDLLDAGGVPAIKPTFLEIP